MPIVFEATFTQPLLAQLDMGSIGGSKALARAITNAYVRTLLTGLPGGGTIPPVLPAPLLGTPPPPFPLPSVPVNNFMPRQRAMQRILQTYFQLREYLPLKEDIRQTIIQIRLLIQKGRRVKQDIKATIAEIKRVQREIAALPNLVEDLKKAAALLIKLEQAKVENLFIGLERFRLTLTPQQFNQLFASELALLNTIKTFRPSLDPAALQELIAILDQLEASINRVPDFSDDNAEQEIKGYIRAQLLTIVRSVITIGNSMVKPEDYVDYYRDIATLDVNYQPIVDTLNRYVTIKRFLEPQLIKLRQKQQELVKKLRVSVEDKLKERREELKEKQKQFAAKRDGKGKRPSFVKAARTIRDTKQKYLRKIKKAKNTIRETQAVIRSAQTATEKLTNFRRSLESVCKTELKAFLQEAQAVPRTQTISQDLGTADIVQEVQVFLAEAGIKDPTIQRFLITEIAVKMPTPYHFIEFFERRSQAFLQIFIDVLSIVNELEFLYAKISSLIGSKRPPLRQTPTTSLEECSLLDVFIFFLKKAQVFTQKVQQKISELARKARQFVIDMTAKLINEVKEQLILLVPIKSDIIDVKNKIDIIRARRNTLVQKKNLIRRRIRQATLLIKTFKAFRKLTADISQGSLRYTTNSANINTVINNLYEFKLLENPNSASAISKEREDVRSAIIDYYYGAELLIDLFTELISVLKKGKLLEALRDYIKRQTDFYLINDYKRLYTQLEGIKNLQPTPRNIVQFIKTADLTIFESSHIQNALFDLESAFFSDIKEKYVRLAENPLVMRVLPMRPLEETIIGKGFKLLADKILKLKAFIDEKIYNKLIKPKLDAVRAKLKRIEQDVNAQVKKLFERQVNLDAKLMTIAFNLATRAFWSGFVWFNPTGTQFVCVSVGPFLPIRAKADDGASAMIRQIARSMNLQLTQMFGTVICPLPTGIPPFPFVGYR